MRKLLPIILALFGTGAGIGAGIAFAPSPEGEMADCVPAEGHAPDEIAGQPAEPAESVTDSEFVKMANQFVVPVVNSDSVQALVVLSLSLEVAPGSSAEVNTREPKLRDVFLQVLFDHANIGGFDGTFTAQVRLDGLREELQYVARNVMGSTIRDVLITEIARQDA